MAASDSMVDVGVKEFNEVKGWELSWPPGRVEEARHAPAHATGGLFRTAPCRVGLSWTLSATPTQGPKSQ